MTGTILIRGARQLLTLHGPKGPRRGAELCELSIIQDGAVLIRNGAVVEVGPTRRVENLAEARDAVEINASGRVVMPGFVDSHTHLVFPPPGAVDLNDAARLVRFSTGQRLEKRTRGCLDAMARHGTTTVEAKTGCGPDESAEIKLLRVLATFKREPLEVVPTFLFQLPSTDLESGTVLRPEAAEKVLADLLAKIRRRRLARFADLAWEPDHARQECFGRYLQAARGFGLASKIHADRPGSGAVALALEHAVAGIDHLEYATADDVAALARSSSIATLLPSTALLNGRRFAPARAFIDGGGAVALASNFNPQYTPALSMQTAVALACAEMAMTPAEAISAATINGAHALGCAGRTGSLELGKSADLLILDLADYHELGSCFGMNIVHTTVRRGEFIYQQGDVAPRAVSDLRLAW